MFPRPRTRRAAWTAALCLSALLGATACSDDDDGGGGSNPASDLTDQLRECGVLTDGDLGAVDIDDESRCVLECVFEQGCVDTRLYICGPQESEEQASYDELLEGCLATCGLLFTCEDGMAIDGSFQCDGFADCFDGSDEDGCEQEQTFACGSGESLPQSARCNYQVDCMDGSDEYNCLGFVCEDGSVIPEEVRCDGVAQCPSGSDEVGCDYFTCNSGEVVRAGARCNLLEECEDASDEYGCAQIVCDEPDTCTNPLAPNCSCVNTYGLLCTRPDAPGCTCTLLDQGSTGQFGACSSDLDCGVGQACFSASGVPPGQCVLVCTDNPNICPAGTGCTFVGGESVCIASGRPPETDICAEDGLYGDGFCDSFCPQPDPDCGGETSDYIYVLVEDLSRDEGGEGPGADIDAISVTVRGVELFATGVVDFSLGGGSWLDPTEALGAPDSACTATNFVSLGGLGGYLMVEFGALFSSGDSVTVYELGVTTCPNQPQWIDEDYRVSVSVSTNFGDFIEIGVGGTGLNTIVVP